MILVVSFALGQASAIVQDAVKSPLAATSEARDAITLLAIVAIAAGLLVLTFLWARRRLAAQREREGLAQAEFERRIAHEFSAASLKPVPPKEHNAPLTAAQAVQSWIAPAREQLLARLREAQLLLSDEGECTLPGCPPESRTVRLRDQRVALIAPFTDSSEFVRANYKRFDLFFLLVSEQETVVLQRYQDYVADKL
jgi:hypothetical protein